MPKRSAPLQAVLDPPLHVSVAHEPCGSRGIVAAVTLAKPGIVMATLLAGYAGMATACGGLPEAGTALAALASIALAAAGAAMLNSVMEAETDRRMVRLARRSASLEHFGQQRACFVALTLIMLSLLVAGLCLNGTVVFLLLTAALTYIFPYTLGCKHRSAWGVLVGGIPGAIPPLIGAAAVAPPFTPGPMLLFFLLFLWQPPHFWALALHNRDDYRAAGIPVLPVTHGENRTRLLIFVFAALLLPASLALSFWGNRSPLFAGAALLLWGLFVASLVRTTLLRRHYDQAFQSSILYLTALLIAVIMAACRG